MITFYSEKVISDVITLKEQKEITRDYIFFVDKLNLAYVKNYIPDFKFSKLSLQ